MKGRRDDTAKQSANKSPRTGATTVQGPVRKAAKPAKPAKPAARRPAGRTATAAGRVSKPATSSNATSRKIFQSEVLGRGTALHRGSSASDRRAPKDVGFFFFGRGLAQKHAWTHLRGNIPTTSDFVTTRQLKLFVMNEYNLNLLLVSHPEAADLQRAVRAVTGVGMQHQELYDKYRYHLPTQEREWKITRCVGKVCTVYAASAAAGYASRALPHVFPAKSAAAKAVAGALAVATTGILATGMHLPRRTNSTKLEVHDKGFLSQEDFVSKTVASKRLALEMKKVLAPQGFDGWVYTDTQARARALIDPRRLGGGIGKFEREVMLWNPDTKLRLAA